MEKVYFATHNLHKIEEVKSMIGELRTLGSAREIEGFDAPEENAPTLVGNAQIKARALFERIGAPCFSDDTGLLVDALDGAPGVHSARFAGQACSDADNRQLMISKLRHLPAPYSARFVTVIVYIDRHGAEHIFEGKVEGEMILTERGSGGFGYDSIFVPQGYTKTFAEMSAEEKNALSHRARAVEKLIDYFQKEAL